MAGEKEIRNKIRSVQNMQKITSAMEKVAASKIRKAQAQLKGQPLPSESEPNQTDFSELTGTATVTNGVIRNQDLAAKSPIGMKIGKQAFYAMADMPFEDAVDFLAVKIAEVAATDADRSAVEADLAELERRIALDVVNARRTLDAALAADQAAAAAAARLAASSASRFWRSRCTW